MNSLENLKIWHKSIELAAQVYAITVDLPNDEKYGLSMQMKRSAVSFSSNIAEGAGRNSKKEFKHFLSIAHGSSYELQTQLTLVEKLELIESKKTKPIGMLISEIQKMNYRLQGKL